MSNENKIFTGLLHMIFMKLFFICIQGRVSRSLVNGVTYGHSRQHNYRDNDMKGSINRSIRTVGTNEELVPMINATNFDDEESEGNMQT